LLRNTESYPVQTKKEASCSGKAGILRFFQKKGSSGSYVQREAPAQTPGIPTGGILPHITEEILLFVNRGNRLAHTQREFFLFRYTGDPSVKTQRESSFSGWKSSYLGTEGSLLPCVQTMKESFC
jgi:hypothetical protein